MRRLGWDKKRDERGSPPLWNVRLAACEDLSELSDAQLGVENSSLFGYKLPHHCDFWLRVYFDTKMPATLSGAPWSPRASTALACR
jgi:hypothetical protein